MWESKFPIGVIWIELLFCWYFPFKIMVLWALIMQFYISDERAASVFSVTGWFKWLLKCWPREYLWITSEGCKVVACYRVCPFFPFCTSQWPISLHLFYITDAVRDCPMANAVRRRPLTAEVRFRSAAISCEIFSERSGTETGFASVNIIQPVLHIHLSVADAI